MIYQDLQPKISEALKAHQQVRLDTLRMLLSAMNYEKIDKQHDLTEEEELLVIRREAKKRKDAIDSLQKVHGNSTSTSENIKERIQKESEELSILEEFLPKQMDDLELAKIVDEVIGQIGQDKSQMGRIMGEVMKKTQGLADGKRVSALVNSKLI